MRLKIWQKFIQLEAFSGIILFIMAILAMVWVNSPLNYLHQHFIDTFLFAINDGLMAIFFLVVGLELKRGFLSGQLSHPSQIIPPAFGALGGMLFPVCIYAMINYANPITIQGWATPIATDIAFALGVLSLFGNRVPPALKLFLLVLAIFDDIGAILIIVLFYSQPLNCFYLLYAILLIAMLYGLNQFSIRTLIPYLVIGILLWFCFLYAGIHPTIAGILLALMIPADPNIKKSLLHRLEKRLHPYVAYFIMPLFALANAGFSLHGLSWSILSDVIVLGIVCGLFVGKQVGVFGFSWLIIKLSHAKLPQNSSWLQLYGVSLLCGIGFTMSLFLGTLSFQNENSIYLAEVRLGVMLGSILSGLTGALILLLAFIQAKSKKRRRSID